MSKDWEEKVRICIKNCNTHYQNWLDGEFNDDPKEFNRMCKKEQDRLSDTHRQKLIRERKRIVEEIKKEVKDLNEKRKIRVNKEVWFHPVYDKAVKDFLGILAKLKSLEEENQ